jgi:hypothetical protein
MDLRKGAKSSFLKALKELKKPYLGFIYDEVEGIISIQAKVKEAGNRDNPVILFPTVFMVYDGKEDSERAEHMRKQSKYIKKYKTWFTDYKNKK